MIASTCLLLAAKFDDELKRLLDELRRQAHREWNLSHLCARLDFNGYYSSYCAHRHSPLVAIHETHLVATVADSRAAAASAGGAEGGGTQRDLVSAVY